MISIADYLAFVDDALEGMVAIVTRLGDSLANERPDLEGGNTPFAVVTHCLGVMEYWAGHVVAGREIERDREAEFQARGSVERLVERVAAARRQLREDVAAAEPYALPRRPPPLDPGFQHLARTQGGALFHVYEELAQHRGQLELTRDMLLARQAQPL